MRTVELAGHSLASVLTLIENQPGSYRHLFRGQPDANWGLLPSLYRVKGLNIGAQTKEEAYAYFESRGIEAFFAEGMPYLPALVRNFYNDRILAQHFGVPTRLIDWSYDPFVALFFAVEDWQQTATDAALFMVMPDAQYLPQQAVINGPHSVIAIRPPAIDRRVAAQKSSFTVHPYGPPNEAFVPLDKRGDIGNFITTNDQPIRGFVKIVIPQRTKRILHHNLLEIGVDRRTLFPGLDGVGADIAARSGTGHFRN